MSKNIVCILSSTEAIEDEMEEKGIVPPWGSTAVGKILTVSCNGDVHNFSNYSTSRWEERAILSASQDKAYGKAVEIAEKLATKSILQTLDCLEDKGITGPEIREALNKAPKADTLPSCAGLLKVLVNMLISDKNIRYRDLIGPIQLLAQMQEMDGPFSREIIDYPPYPCLALPGAGLKAPNATINFFILY